MFLMLLSQEDREIALALFDTMESGQRFAETIPGYRRVQDEIGGMPYEYETISPAQLPNYAELSYKGNLLPITRHMFAHDEDIDVFWQEIPNLDKADQGLVSGGTRVDAYVVPNNEVKAFIADRERGYERVKVLLEKRDYRVWRDFAGSEDGEAILCQAQGSSDEQIFAYLDPSFIDDTNTDDKGLSKWVAAQLGLEG